MVVCTILEIMFFSMSIYAVIVKLSVILSHSSYTAMK